MTAHPSRPPIPQPRVRFAGNLSDVVPRELLFDRDLTPNEVVLWQHMAIMARQNESMEYRPLMERLGVSRPTLANMLLILRLTRWLSHDIEPGRDQATGTFEPTSYVLHDSRCPIEQLDPEQYSLFVQAHSQHRSPRVRILAERLLQQMAQQAELHEANQFPSLLEQRLVKNQLLNGLLVSGTHRVKNFNSVETPPETRVKNFNSAYIYNNIYKNNNYYNSVYSLFDHLLEPAKTPNPPTPLANTPKTTAPSESLSSEGNALHWEGPLAELNDNERQALLRSLSGLPLEQRQAVLDESHGAILAKQQANLLRTTPLRFAMTLAKRALSGEFQMTWVGKRIAQARQGQSPSGTTSDITEQQRPASQSPLWQKQGFNSEKDYERCIFEFSMQRYQPNGVQDVRLFFKTWQAQGRQG